MNSLKFAFGASGDMHFGLLRGRLLQLAFVLTLLSMVSACSDSNSEMIAGDVSAYNHMPDSG